MSLAAFFYPALYYKRYLENDCNTLKFLDIPVIV